MSSIYLRVAEQQGFAPAVARTVYHTIEMLVAAHGYGNSCYGYRTGARGTGEATGSSPSRDQEGRVLVLFPSPDAALALAQHYHIQPTPRLFSLHLSQLLAIMLERPAIGSLLFSDDYARISQRISEFFQKPAHGWEHLPIRFRLDRTILLHMLKGYEL